MNEENSPESTSPNQEAHSNLEEGEVSRDVSGEEEHGEMVAFDHVDELYDSDELPEEIDESEDGFSLEALSKAYAKAVAKQNEQLGPESTSEIDFGDSRKSKNDDSDDRAGEEDSGTLAS